MSPFESGFVFLPFPKLLLSNLKCLFVILPIEDFVISTFGVYVAMPFKSLSMNYVVLLESLFYTLL